MRTESACIDGKSNNKEFILSKPNQIPLPWTSRQTVSRGITTTTPHLFRIKKSTVSKEWKHSMKCCHHRCKIQRCHQQISCWMDHQMQVDTIQCEVISTLDANLRTLTQDSHLNIPLSISKSPNQLAIKISARSHKFLPPHHQSTPKPIPLKAL